MELSIGEPLIKSLLDVFLSEVEGLLGILSARLLQAPGRRVVEVKTAWHVATIVVPLDVEAGLDIWVGFQGLLDRVSVAVEGALVTSVEPISRRVLAHFIPRLLTVAANDDIHDDVFLFVAHVEALVHGGGDVDVPDSAAVHQNVALEVLGWEDHRDRAR